MQIPHFACRVCSRLKRNGRKILPFSVVSPASSPYLCLPLDLMPCRQCARRRDAETTRCVLRVSVCPCLSVSVYVVYEDVVIGVISRVVVELSDHSSCRARTRVR